MTDIVIEVRDSEGNIDRRKKQVLCFLDASVRYGGAADIRLSESISVREDETVVRILVLCGKGDPIREISKLPRRFKEITFSGEGWLTKLTTWKGKTFLLCEETGKWVREAGR